MFKITSQPFATFSPLFTSTIPPYFCRKITVRLPYDYHCSSIFVESIPMARGRDTVATRSRKVVKTGGTAKGISKVSDAITCDPLVELCD